MSDTSISTPTYQTLVTDLSAIIKAGQQQALSAVNQIKLQTYWDMGKRMSQASELADSSVSQLAIDLDLEPSLLYRIRQFYQLWPDSVPTVDKQRISDSGASGTESSAIGKTLSWSHFVELISIPDAKERDFYLEEAVAKNWSRDNLRTAIEKDYYTSSQSPKKLKSTDALERPENPLNVYKAVVEKVVDGDTLLVRIDLGFDVWVNSRTRFRGINTGELTERGVPIADATERAVKAKEFVQKKLEGLPFVVIKTYKTDMYGRYVSDVFYHPTITKKEDVYEEGFFLNAELLEANLADIML